ncbi:MAG: universal stress protein, partial [Pseudorhizobium sp.]
DQVARNPILAGLPCKLVMAGPETSDSRRKIEDASIILKAAGFAVETEIAKGEPGTVISETIEREKFDLLVMGAYSHSRLRSLFLGSTTTQMIQSSKVPVVIFR